MTLDETIEILAALNRASLVYIAEGTSNVWHAALADIDPDDAQAACLRLLRTQRSGPRSLAPGDLRAMVQLIRRERAEAAHQASVAQQIARARALPPAAPPPELAAVIASTRERKTGGALTVACPWCKARPRDPCTSMDRPLSRPHPSRLDAYATTEAKEPAH